MPNTLKFILKRCFQYAAAHLGKHRFTLVEEPELLLLMYHRILPDDDPRLRFEEPGMVVTPSSFETHLQTLKKEFEVMKLSDWIDRKQNGKPLPKKACAITFDDGWADNYEYAYPILKRHNFPATIFLVSDMIGTDDMFWPERIARLVVKIAETRSDHWHDDDLQWLTKAETGYSFDQSIPAREQLSEIIANCKALTDKQIHQHIDDALQKLDIDIDSDSPSLLNWQQVDEMAASELVEYGSHTCTHQRLTANTPEPELKHQIADSKKTLKNRLNCDIEMFCFPNGDYTHKTLDYVIRHYNSAVTTGKGWNVKSNDSYRLRRVGVHQDIAYDRIAFLACISDWM